MRGLTLLLILAIAILVWSSNMETCHARQGKHWRQSRGALYKKKPKYHRQHGNAGKIKQKHPSPKPSSPPAPVSPPSIGSGNAGRVFNVVSYGAKGDGNTDDTKVKLNFIIHYINPAKCKTQKPDMHLVTTEKKMNECES